MRLNFRDFKLQNKSYTTFLYPWNIPGENKVLNKINVSKLFP